MTKEQIKRFIITNFLERNYSIYTSITDSSICIQRDGLVGTAIILTTTHASNDRIILDLRLSSNRLLLGTTKYTYIIAFNQDTKEIWLIPVDDIADNRTLQLNDKKSHYLLLEHAPNFYEPVISELALREAVKKTISKIELKKYKEQTEEEHTKQIDDIVNAKFDS